MKIVKTEVYFFQKNLKETARNGPAENAIPAESHWQFMKSGV